MLRAWPALALVLLLAACGGATTSAAATQEEPTTEREGSVGEQAPVQECNAEAVAFADYAEAHREYGFLAVDFNDSAEDAWDELAAEL